LMSTLHRSFVGIDMRTKKHMETGGVAALVLAGLSIPLIDGWLVQAATNPAPSRDVGYIERIVGDPKDVRIDRQGKSMQPAILLPLRADDRVFLKQGSELYLQLGNRRVVIAEKDSPYRVPRVDAPPAFLTRLRSTLVSLGAKLTSQYVRSSVPVSTSSRGHEGPLSMPVVEDDVSRLGSHRTTIHIAWEGGTAPFAVQVLSGNGKTFATKERIQEWRLQLPWMPGAIPEGPARIVVEDGAGQRISKLINLVPVHNLPERVAQGDLPPTLHAVIAADQLIQANRRQWGFEAYQDLAALADSYEPARLLRDCLEAIPSCYQR
ncbi:MAG TPA: hypothetical protein VKB33_04920, partial [Nitrospira sp.]|nr:hypothetical protein [Nitrospira sp.]